MLRLVDWKTVTDVSDKISSSIFKFNQSYWNVWTRKQKHYFIYSLDCLTLKMKALSRKLTKRNDSDGYTRVITNVSAYVILRDQLHTHPSDKHVKEVKVA